MKINTVLSLQNLYGVSKPLNAAILTLTMPICRCFVDMVFDFQRLSFASINLHDSTKTQNSAQLLLK